MESIRADRRKLSRKLSCNSPAQWLDHGRPRSRFRHLPAVRPCFGIAPWDRAWQGALARTAVWAWIRRWSGDSAGAQGRDIVRRNPASDRFGSEFVREGLKPATLENASKQNTSKQKMTASILFRSERIRLWS